MIGLKQIPRGAALFAALSALTVLVIGCATVPSAGTPVDYTRVADPGTQVRETAPDDGLGPLEITRGYIAANARVDQDIKLGAARAYLAPDVKAGWHIAPTTVMILAGSPRFDMVSGTDDQVQVSGLTDGYLNADGSYVPTLKQEFKAVIGLAKIDDQWRIVTAPAQLIMYVGDFNLAYAQRQVYFINSTATLVVPDRRWLPNSSLYTLTMADQLFNRLVNGPSPALGAAVHNQLADVRLRVPISAGKDGVLQIDLTGVESLSSTNARLLAAQLVYSLRSDAANIRILVDGAPLDANQAVWTTGVLGSFNPDGVPGSGSPGALGYYLNSKGAMTNLRGPPVWGTAGTGELKGLSAAMSAATGDVAIVGRSANGQSLYIGAPLSQQPLEERLTAASFTPPSFSRAGDEVWTVINGSTALEVVRLLTAGIRYPVESSNLAGIGEVTDLALSPDGVWVAIVAGQKLYLSTVVYADNPDATHAAGSAASTIATLTSPVLLRSELTVNQAIWSDSQNMLVTASDSTTTYRTVWRIGMDGRQRTPLTTRGILADVDAIAATGALPTLISSGGRILQLQGDDTSGQWASVNPEGPPATGTWPLYPT